MSDRWEYRRSFTTNFTRVVTAVFPRTVCTVTLHQQLLSYFHINNNNHRNACQNLQGGANKPDYCTFQMSSRKFAPNNAYNTSFVTDELQMTCCLPTLVKTTDQSHAASWIEPGFQVKRCSVCKPQQIHRTIVFMPTWLSSVMHHCTCGILIVWETLLF